MYEKFYENYYTEEQFSIEHTNPRKVTLRSVEQYISLSIGFWGLWLVPTVFCLASEQWHWEQVDYRLRYLIVGFSLFALHVTIKFIPRYIIITVGSDTFTYSYGFNFIAFHSTKPLDQIKGIYVSTQRYGKGSSVPHLAIGLHDKRKDFFFARYSENDVAVERAHYLSKATGLPVIVVGLREAIRPRGL